MSRVTKLNMFEPSLMEPVTMPCLLMVMSIRYSGAPVQSHPVEVRLAGEFSIWMDVYSAHRV